MHVGSGLTGSGFVPDQVLVLVEVLEEGRLTDQLLLLTHLLTGLSRFGHLHLQGAERRPHHLAVAEVLSNKVGQVSQSPAGTGRERVQDLPGSR